MKERNEEREYRGANDIEMDASYALVISVLPPWLLHSRSPWLPFRPAPRGPWG